MNHVRLVLSGLVFLAFTIPPIDAAAQGRGSVELGFDARLAKVLYADEFQGVTEPVDDAFVTQVPIAMVRVGPYLSDRLQLEPSVGYSHVSVEGEGYHEVNLGLDLLLYLGNPDAAAPFFRIGPGLRWVSYAPPEPVALPADDTATQVSLGGGFGVRAPAGDRLAMRLQVAAERNFESDEFRASWDLGVMFGLSFFTK